MFQRRRFFSLSTLILLFFVFLCIVSITVAQEATPEATEPLPINSPIPVTEFVQPTIDVIEPSSVPPTLVETPPSVPEVPTIEPPATVEQPTLEVIPSVTADITSEITTLPLPPVETIPTDPPQSLITAESLLVVTNINDSGEGSLRAAIEYSNSHPGADTITFNIPGNGPHAIQITTSLPTIGDIVTIDGLSQPGATCDVWPPTLKVVLSDPLNIEATQVNIRGLVIPGMIIEAGNSTIQCNFIGTDVTGMVSTGNFYGILLRGFSGLIGGIGPGTRNLISGNEFGIAAEENGVNNLDIQGNYIGTDVTGQFALGNGTGISMDTVSGFRIGATTPGAGNLISGNGTGIAISFDSDFSIIDPLGSIQGNFIGTNLYGTAAIPNGLGIHALAPVQIGGSDSGARNLISGNLSCGIRTYSDGNSGMSVVQGNYIGTDITGTLSLPNSCGIDSTDGVSVLDNLISGNNGPGVIFLASLAGGGNLLRNIIGADVTGTQPLGNQAEGVRIANLFTVGTVYVTDNVIAHNSGAGVTILDPFAGNPDKVNDFEIGENRIFANGGLGIDLMHDGVTLNDPGDLLGLQNFPVLDIPDAGATVITGSLDTRPDETFTIRFFVNSTCDPDGYGEGETFLGESQVLTDGFGQAILNLSVSSLTTGQYITATATSSRATSEFSWCVRVGGDDSFPSTIVTNTNNSGLGSLRAAIEYANSNPGPDTITFNIPGDGPHTIQPFTPLPAITDTATIDGTSQPGASCEVWPPTLKIELTAKLLVEADNTQIRGLVFNRSGGIETIEAYTDITCNFIGTDVTGTVAMNDQWAGIIVADAFIKIGGTSPTERNLISGNFYGIFAMEGGAAALTIQGNYIGTDVTGQFDLGNGAGISIDTVSGITIGGTSPGAGNLISGNGIGISIGYDTDFTISKPLGTIQGNIIGANATGTSAIPNDTGVGITYPMVIGGDQPGARNLISGNTGCGIRLGSLQRSTGTIVEGNYIGTDITGTLPLANGCGLTASEDALITDNVISGNRGDGVAIRLGTDQGFTNLQNNNIGMDVTGTKPLGNQGNGVNIDIPFDDSISGVGVSGNLIAHNGGTGVSITDSNAGNPDILYGYSIGGNRIFANSGLGIDILNDGVTPNDVGDADGNDWALQNFPELNAPSNGATSVTGKLNSLPDGVFTIDVYANTTCDSSGYGEGEIFLGRGTATMDASGNAAFNVNVTPLQAGQYITATASSYAATSEFSSCVRVSAGPQPPQLRYPMMNDTVSTSRPAFSWNAVPNARRYRIQIASDANFTSILVDTLEDSLVKAPITLLPGGYYWRLQTQSRSGVWGAFSEVRYFEYVIMYQPVDEGRSYGRFPIFNWNAYPKALRYQLEIDNNSDFSSPESVCVYTHRVLSSRPCGLPDGLPYGDYFWRVNIDLGNGFIPSPISWSFSIVIRYVSPPAPLSPTGEVTDYDSVLFTWGTVPGAIYYQVQISSDPSFATTAINFTDNTVPGNEYDWGHPSPGRYYWRVRAWMSNGAPTVWSATVTFDARE